MLLSRRILSMPESSIRKLIPHADAAKGAGKKVYHLNIGQPDIPTPEAFFQGIREFSEPVVSYAPSQGLPELLEVFSEYYQQQGIDLAPEEILVTNGGSEALVFAFTVLCDPGDEILVPEPYYASYGLVASATDVKLVPVPTAAETGFHLPGPEEFRQAITARTKAIVVTNPGNPTGTVFTKEELNMVAELAQENDLFIIADEVYREFVYDGEFVSILQLPQVQDRAVLVDSISKRFSACGARIGCFASKNKQVMEQAVKAAQARLSVATVDQVGAIALAKTPASYFAQVKDEYRRRRDVTMAALAQMPGVFCRQPEGAFYVLASLPVPDAEEFATWLLRDFSYQGATVMLAPASGFYMTPGQGKNQVRIAYVLKEADLVAAYNILREGLAVYSGAGK